MNKVLKRLKEFKDEESRYAYADAVTNAFLTGQIKALREERGLTQEQLAALVGTQQSGISRWLNSGFSTCKVETLRKFARSYGVRLRISFEPFSTLPTDIEGFTKERLAPRRFEDDPAFKEHPKQPEGAAAAQRRFALRDHPTGWDAHLHLEKEATPLCVEPIAPDTAEEAAGKIMSISIASSSLKPAAAELNSTSRPNDNPNRPELGLQPVRKTVDSAVVSQPSSNSQLAV